ncbi:MAG: hypothetical protein H6R18_106 [Proteobacteria bacterium]|nr:hypothetical protein [Pseudomonadota bacterium]
MKPLCILALGGLLTLPAQAENGVDLTMTSRLIGEFHQIRPDSPFAAGLARTGFGRDNGRFEEEVRGKLGSVSVLLTGSFSGQEGQNPKTRLVANEAFIDFGSGADRFTIGKKILSGDVGYAFRPIDVVQREARMQLIPKALEGIPNLMWEHYSGQQAWSLIIANPDRNRGPEPNKDGSLTLRYFNRIGVTDLHGVARYSSRYRLEAGAAFSSVPESSLEIHGSFLVQQRGERTVPIRLPANANPILLLARSADDPNIMISESLKNPAKALLGATWTTDNGWSVLAETWWDGTAPKPADWQNLVRQTQIRNAMLGMPGIPAEGVNGALALSTRMFQNPSSTRRGNLLRVSWTDPAGSGWSTALDVLQRPQGGGWIATLSAAWVADKLRIEGGYRRYGGSANSVYRLLPEHQVIFAGISLAF